MVVLAAMGSCGLDEHAVGVMTVVVMGVVTDTADTFAATGTVMVDIKEDAEDVEDEEEDEMDEVDEVEAPVTNTVEAADFIFKSK